MNAKMYLTGVVGGILCSLALWFPLAEYLPSTLLNDWGAVNANLAWGLVSLSCLILLACGAVAARMSGTKSRVGASISGAVAGWVAAMMSYIMVGGAAAGVWGARPILEFGLRPAANQAQFIQLLVDSITGIYWWTMLALWGAMLLGLGLGALGGLLAGPAGEPDPDMTLIYQIVAVGGMLTSGLMLTIETSVLTLMDQVTTKAAADVSLIPAYSITTVIVVFPIITMFLMMLGSLLLWWVFYRQRAAAGQVMDMQVRLSAAVLLGMPILTLIFVFLIYPQSMFSTLYLPFFIVVILAGGWIMRHVWMNSSPTWNNTLNFRVIMFSASLCFIVIEAGVYFSAVPAALGNVMLVIPPIAVLMPDGSGTPTITDVVELVHENYAAYRNIGLISMLVNALYTLILSGLVLILMRFLARRSLRISSESAEPESKSTP